MLIAEIIKNIMYEEGLNQNDFAKKYLVHKHKYQNG